MNKPKFLVVTQAERGQWYFEHVGEKFRIKTVWYGPEGDVSKYQVEVMSPRRVQLVKYNQLKEFTYGYYVMPDDCKIEQPEPREHQVDKLVRAWGNFPALSIRQPWAYAILKLGKDIENRTWTTQYRGRFYIHAGMRLDKEGYDFLIKTGFELPPSDQLNYGGILGICDLADVVDKSDSQWFLGPYGFKLENIKETRFVRFPGKLQFFNIV